MAGAHERVIASRRTWWRGRAPWGRMTGASAGAATWRRSIYRGRPSSSPAVRRRCTTSPLSLAWWRRSIACWYPAAASSPRSRTSRSGGLPPRRW